MRVVGVRRIHFAFQPVIAAIGVILAASCGRTDLDLLDWGTGLPDSSFAGTGGGPADAAQELPVLPDAERPAPPTCQPAEETCNGRDDDCNGQVDDVPGIPCPGGGFRYCVAGRLSECPQRCEKCLPGSERICYISYCKFWAVQTCAADGRSFGICREDDPPPECREIARTKHDSPELEQCCIDAGHCCLDEFDLDKDGDRNEMLGACEEVACTQ
jgi:hypothetical protein